jgi:DNA polymerase alpha-associated DNA helicase A
MNEKIMKWPSIELYEDKLIADNSVKSHLLRDLPNISDTSDTSLALLYIDTAGCELREAREEEGVCFT